MNKIFYDKNFEIYKKTDIYVIKILKGKIKKNSVIKYHNKLIGIYDEYENNNKKFSLIFNLLEAKINIVSFAAKEFKFFNKLTPRTDKSVNSIVVICKKFLCNVIKILIPKKRKVPYAVCENMELAMKFTIT